MTAPSLEDFATDVVQTLLRSFPGNLSERVFVQVHALNEAGMTWDLVRSNNEGLETICGGTHRWA